MLDRIDRSIVAVLELLSPTNKFPGSVGRTSFVRKRLEVCATDAHWLEIDLLRGGLRTANIAAAREVAYQAYLSRAGKPRRAYVWPIPLRERLPVIGVPLRHGDADAALDLQAALDQTYDMASYDIDLDYQGDPRSPLRPEDAEWARVQIAAAAR